MRVRDLPWDSRDTSNYLPHTYPRHCVCYTGTHDNSPVELWRHEAAPEDIAYAKRYLEYYNLRAVDAQEVGRNAFVSTGYSWDNTPLWRTSGKAVAAVLDSLSISTAVNQNTASGSESETAGVLPALLPQRDTGHLPDANAADAVKATVNFQSGGATGVFSDDHLAAGNPVGIEGVQRLAEFKKDEIGHIDHIVNRFEADRHQFLLKPFRRRAHLHALDGDPAIARSGCRILNLDRNTLPISRLPSLHGRVLE